MEKRVTIDVIKGTIVNNKTTRMKQEDEKYFKMNFIFCDTIETFSSNKYWPL